MDIEALVRQAAISRGVDPDFAASIANTEGGYRNGQSLVSSKGAIGPMQLMPATAQELGGDPNDLMSNIDMGVRYAGQMLKRYNGDRRLAAAAYNAGPGAVDRAGGVPNYPETQEYVNKVAGPQFGAKGITADMLQGGAAPAASEPGASTGPIGAAGITADMLATPGQLNVRKPEAIAPESPSLLSQAGHEAKLFGRNALEVGSGLLGIVGDPLNYVSNKLFGTNLPMVSQTGSQAADAMNLDRPQGKLEEAVNPITKGVMGAAIPVGAGTAMARSANPLAASIGNSLSGNAAQQLGAAVTGSAAAEGTQRAAQALNVNPMGQQILSTAAGIIGGVPGANLAGRMANGVPAEIAATQAAAKDANIPLLGSDLSQGMAAAKKFADKVPVGNLVAANVPEQQVAGIRSALDSAAQKYKPDALVESGGTTGTDRYLAGQLRQQYNAGKKATSAAYDAVENEMAKTPNLPPVNLQSTADQVAELERQFPGTIDSLTLPSNVRATMGKLKNLSTLPEQPPITIGGVQVTPDSNPAMWNALKRAGAVQEPELPAISFPEARKLSSALYSAADQAQKKAIGGSMSQAQVGALKSLAGAVGDDVSAHMENMPAKIQELYGAADSTFKNRVLPFRQDPTVYGVVSSRTPATDYDLKSQGLYQNLFGPNQGQRSQMALQLLTPSGRSAVAYQTLKDMSGRALNTASDEGLNIGQARRSLNPETNASLDNILQAMPELGGDVDRIRSLLEIGRGAARDVAGKNAKTGYANLHDMGTAGIGAAAMYGWHHGGPVGAATLAGALPLGANAFNLINRLSGQSRLLFSSPGSTADYLGPAIYQGLLAGQETKK